MKQLSSKQGFTRGYIRARPAGKAGRWQLDWRDPETGRRLQRRIRAASVQEVRDTADHLSREVPAGRLLLPAQRQFKPTVDEAIQEAIAASRGNVQTRREYVGLANLFGKWLNEARPGIASWAEVTTTTLRDYLDHCRILGLSSDQIRKRLYVLKMTSRYMAQTYAPQFQDVAGPVRFIRQAENPLRLKEREAQKALDAATLFAFLDWLRQRRPDLHAVACLQGLAGLRALEAVHLREQDVDFEAATITVDDTPDHRPKNKSSYRTIPVAARVMQSLKDVLCGLKVRRPDGYLFATARGDRPWSVSGYCHAMKRELLGCWKASGIEAFRHFRPHWLRATFASLVRAQRADFRVLQTYLGHAPSDTLGRFYEQTDLGRMQAEIVSVVERICEHCREQGKEAATHFVEVRSL